MKKTFKLIDLDCANCAAKMEDAIRRIDGVTAVTVSFMTQKLTLEAEDRPPEGGGPGLQKDRTGLPDRVKMTQK